MPGSDTPDIHITPTTTVVADAHNDLLLEVEFAGGHNPFAARWLDKLDAGNVRLQVCAVAADAEWLPDAALRRSLLLTQAFHQALDDNSERVTHVTTGSDLDAAGAGSRIGLVLALEGAEPLCGEPLLADVFFALGYRLFGLTWSVRNVFADGQNEASDGGLSNVGRTLVERIVRLGGIIDLAHASPRTFEQILALTDEAPVMVSHAGCAAVYDIRRNLSDTQLRLLAERDGFLGVMAIPLAVHASDWSLDKLVDHIEHAVSILGIDRVGLGGDFVRQIWEAGAISKRMELRAALPAGMDGSSIVDGLGGPEDYGNLERALRDRGFDADAAAAVMGQNLVRFLRDRLPDGGGAL